MKRFKFFTALTILLSVLNINAQIDDSQKGELNDYVDEIIGDYEIYGGAIAVMKGNEVIYIRYFGNSDIETNTQVSEKTIFPIFSTTKIFTAVAAHELIEEGIISLEDPVSLYLKDLPANWKMVKVKNLLSFSSGLPEINRYSGDNENDAIQKVFADTIRFKPGVRFEYNQTNSWLLDRLVIKVTNKSIPDLILETQFSRKNSAVKYDGLYSNRVPNRAIVYAGYGPKGPTGERAIAEYNVAKFVYAGSGFNISLDEFVNWNKSFYNEKFITNQTKNKLFEFYKYEKPHNFTLGWSAVIDYKGNHSFGFTGSGFTGYRVFPKDDISVILLTNGSLRIMPINGFLNRMAEIVTTPVARTDEEKVKMALNDYIDGTADGIPARIKRAFHEDLNLYSISNDTLRVTSGRTYSTYFGAGQKRNRIGKIISIDIVNDAAMAKLEIDYPERKTLYTDYILLLRIEGIWKIIHKSYTSIMY